jgi:hypothetical protein
MSALVYQAINAIVAELSCTGIARNHRNEEGDYLYRSIDDVLGALAPLLARHRLCVLPRVLEREAVRSSRTSNLVSVHVAFDLVSALDGSVHTIESFGEAIDDSDKGTAKAISSAFKLVMLQAFCIPVPQDDVDATSPRLHPGKLNGASLPEPPEGWESWVAEAIDIVSTCQSAEAVDRLCSGRRQLLSALQHARPELYAKVGEAIAARLVELKRLEPKASTLPASASARPGAEQVGSSDGAKAPTRTPRRTASQYTLKETADAADQPAKEA